MIHINYRVQAKTCFLNAIKSCNPIANSVIICVHGGPGSGAHPMMEIPAIRMLEQAFSIVYYDQRGSGKSEYPLSNGLSIQQITDDLKCIVEHTKTQFPNQPIYLLGCSFGGLLALLFLKRYPFAVDKVVVSSALLDPTNESFQQIQFKLLKKSAKKLFSRELVQKLNSYGDTKEDALAFLKCEELKSYLNSFDKPPKGKESIFHMQALGDWLFTEADMRASIETIQVPTLFLQGRQDPFCQAGILIDAIKQYPNKRVELMLFSPCGHAIFEQYSKDFCKACVSFFYASHCE